MGRAIAEANGTAETDLTVPVLRVENAVAPSFTGRMVRALWPVFSRPEQIARYFALASLGLLQ